MLTDYIHCREFDINCTTVNIALISQIKKWTSPDNCKQGGEKCLYEVGISIVLSDESAILSEINTRFPSSHSKINLKFLLY